MSRLVPPEAAALFVVILLSATTAHAQLSVSVTIGRIGLIAANGTALVPVKVACTGGDPLEALITVSQDGEALFGQGSIGTVICDGTPRWSLSRTRAVEGRFHRGEAYASAYVLICQGDECVSAGDSNTFPLIRRP